MCTPKRRRTHARNQVGVSAWLTQVVVPDSGHPLQRGANTQLSVLHAVVHHGGTRIQKEKEKGDTNAEPLKNRGATHTHPPQGEEKPNRLKAASIMIADG